MLVIELHSLVDADEVRRNGMVVLDGSNRSAVVAFVDDPAMALFHERLDAYRGDIPEGQKSPKYEAFFDALVSIRPYGSTDRISKALAAHVEQLSEPEMLRLDVRCWHPDDGALAAEWLRDCREGAKQAGGEVTSTYQNDSIGLLIARVYLPSNRLAEFAVLDVIASIDRLPATGLSKADFHSINVDQLPEISAPARNAPILGLIDSGVASAHPLIEGTVLAAEALSPHIADGEDRHGHGTMVASLALYGPIPSALKQARLVPIAKLVSVAVLDHEAGFPDESLWESDLAEAIEYCVGQGARVINVSLGDPTRPFEPPRQPAIASIVDHLARLHQVVIVASTGNADPEIYLSDLSADSTESYVADLLQHAETGIIPPGTAALALTVGGIAARSAAGGFVGREPAERRGFGEAGWPSTITRRGHGMEGAIKPELVAPSGTHGQEPGRRVLDAELGVIGAATGHAGRLLRADLGTSYAAPLVSRVALAVVGRFPDFSANLVRALTLLGATPTWDGSTLRSEQGEISDSLRRDSVRRLNGYGETSLGGALEVGSHRAVLVAEGSIAMDAVHVYELPIPSSFYESGGSRYLDVALAFDPPTRSQRLDYLGNKIETYVVRDIEMTELLETFSKVVETSDEDVPTDADTRSGDEVNESGDGASSVARWLGEVLGSRLLKFDSSVTERSRSANQLGRKQFRQRWSAPNIGGTYLVVRNVNRWCDSSMFQTYALAVSLRRDTDQPEIYAELAARLEPVIELEIEVETELESQI